MTRVAEPTPGRVIVVCDRFDQAQSWARNHGLPYGSVVFVKAEGDNRSNLVLHGLSGLPYVELAAPNDATAAELVYGGHYRLGGS